MKIENAKTLLIPERAGNNLAFGLQNILATGSIGLIFVRPNTGETLRVSGKAEVFDDADLLQQLGSEKTARAAGDPRAYAALLLSLCAIVPAREALGAELLGREEAHLVRQGVRAEARHR